MLLGNSDFFHLYKDILDWQHTENIFTLGYFEEVGFFNSGVSVEDRRGIMNEILSVLEKRDFSNETALRTKLQEAHLSRDDLHARLVKVITVYSLKGLFQF